MPRALVEETQTGFSGLNVSSDPAHLGPTEITRAANAKFTLFGGVTPRLGSQRVHATALPGPVQGIYQWFDSTSGAQLLVVAGGNLYVAQTTTTPPWSFALVGAVSVSGAVTFAEFTDATGTPVVYFGAYPQGVYKYSASPFPTGTLTLVVAEGGSPPTSYLCVQNQRLFGIAGTGAGGSLANNLFWSSLNSGDDLGIPSVPGAGGNAVVLTFGEANLTAMLAYGPGLLIGQFGGLSMFAGWSTSDITIEAGTQGVSASTGVHSPFGMVAVENYAVLTSDRGAYVLTPYGILQQISRPLDTLWKTQIFGLPNVSGPPLQTLHDKVNGTVYFQTTLNTYYGYNYRTQGWFGPWTFNWSGATPTLACTAYDYIGGNWYILVGGSDGYVRRIEAPGLGLDDVLSNGTGGNQYQMRVTLRPLAGLDPQTNQPAWDQEKAWRWMDIQAQLVNPSAAQVTATTYPAEGGAVVTNNLAPAYNNQPDATPRTYRMQVGSRGQAVVLDIYDTPISNPAGQNVYISARALGYNYGRRY